MLFSWTFDDGGAGEQRPVSHSFATAGSHQVDGIVWTIGTFRLSKTINVVESIPTFGEFARSALALSIALIAAIFLRTK
jgi:hypothetical protein